LIAFFRNIYLQGDIAKQTLDSYEQDAAERNGETVDSEDVE
jgi:hypothetical protein